MLSIIYTTLMNIIHNQHIFFQSIAISLPPSSHLLPSSFLKILQIQIFFSTFQSFKVLHYTPSSLPKDSQPASLISLTASQLEAFLKNPSSPPQRLIHTHQTIHLNSHSLHQPYSPTRNIAFLTTFLLKIDINH